MSFKMYFKMNQKELKEFLKNHGGTPAGQSVQQQLGVEPKEPKPLPAQKPSKPIKVATVKAPATKKVSYKQMPNIIYNKRFRND